MGLSKRYLDRNTSPVKFDPVDLADGLERECPEIIFSLLIGSAADGLINPHSDLDLAVFLEDKASLSLYSRVNEICDKIVPGIRCDLGILNNSEPVFRFEALKGRLLFTRDQEVWLKFYSLTCREYEHWMYHYEKQKRYRLELHGGGSIHG